MFVPLVGFLFTHDSESASRYAYYNKLERHRRFRAYRQLTAATTSFDEHDEEDEDENEEEQEANTGRNELHETAAMQRWVIEQLAIEN